MIQRIQTVYLILTLVFCGIIYFVPLSILLPEVGGGLLYKLDVFGIKYSSDEIIVVKEYTYALLAFLGFASLIAMVTIFLFKKRHLQMKLCRLASIFLLVFVVLVFYYTDKMKSFSEVEASISFLTGTYLPFIAIILLLLANRAIKSDDDLVRSADRLR